MTLTSVLTEQFNTVNEIKTSVDLNGEAFKTFKFATETVYPKIQALVVQTRSIGGETLIWGNETFGIWGTYKWGNIESSSFILGNESAGILGSSTLGSNLSSFETIRVVPPDDIFEENFLSDFFISTDSTATYDSTNCKVTFTAGQDIKSESIDYNNGTINYATLYGNKINNIPIRYFKLNETSGDAIDSAGSINGTVTGSVQNYDGMVNNCYKFNGGTDKVTVPIKQVPAEFSVAAKEPVTNGLFFKPDGLKMYIVGSTSPDSVYQYTLGTAWDITSATYSKTLSVTAKDTDPQDLFFSSDGSKMYILGNANNKIYQYALSTAWDVSTGTYSKEFSVTEGAPTGLFIDPTGVNAYICGRDSDKIVQYSMSTPWDISTCSYVGELSIASVEANSSSLFFKPDGLKMYFIGRGDRIYQYTLSTAWDITTALFDNICYGTIEGETTGLQFKPDGTHIYYVGTNNDKIYDYTLPAAWTLYDDSKKNQTIMMWLKPTSFAVRMNPWQIAFGGNGAITQEPTGTITYYYGSIGTNNSPYQGFQTLLYPPINEWSHITIVRDLDNMKLRSYLNGNLITEIDALYPHIVGEITDMLIGSGYTNGYVGSIDDLREYDYVLTENEIKTIVQERNENFGSFEYFMNADGNTSQFSTGTITGATYTTGIVGSYAIDVASGNSVVSTIPLLTNPYTISFWWNPVSSWSGIVGLIGLNALNARPYIGTGSNGRLLLYCGLEKYVYTPNNTFIPGNWYHVICEVSGTNATDLHIYVNNVLSDGTRGSNTGSIDSPTTTLRVGGNTREDKFDEILVYNRVLTSGEKTILFNKGIVYSGLVAKYSFEEGSGNYAFDTSNWERVENGVKYSFENTGQDLKYIAAEKDGSKGEINKITVKINK